MPATTYPQVEGEVASPSAPPTPQQPTFEPTGKPGQGWSMYSPNTDTDLDFNTAYSRLGSSNHAAFRSIVDDVLRNGGVQKYETHDAIGDWQDGAENSFLTTITQPIDPETSKYLGSWLGLLANQKSVLHFTSTGEEGPDSLYQIYIPRTSAANLREELSRYGITFRTIVPKGDGHVVAIYDQGKSLRPNVGAFGAAHNAVIREAIGRGEFLGDSSGNSRTAARHNYRQRINSFESSRSKVRQDSPQPVDGPDARPKKPVKMAAPYGARIAGPFGDAPITGGSKPAQPTDWMEGAPSWWHRGNPREISRTPPNPAGGSTPLRGLAGVLQSPQTPSPPPEPEPSPASEQPTKVDTSKPFWWSDTEHPKFKSLASPLWVRWDMKSVVGKWLGKDPNSLESEDIANLCSVLPDTKYNIRPADPRHGSDAITITLNHPELHGELTLKTWRVPIKAGNFSRHDVPLLFVDELKAKSPGNGWSLALVGHQAAAAKKLGVNAIGCFGGRGGTPTGSEQRWVGYKIWPKFGFDGPIPEEAKRHLMVAEKFNIDGVTPEHVEAGTIQKLLSLPNGQKIWETHGVSAPMWLDLTEGSKGLEILHHQMERWYKLMARRKVREAAKKAPAGGEVVRGVAYPGGKFLPEMQPAPIATPTAQPQPPAPLGAASPPATQAPAAPPPQPKKPTTVWAKPVVGLDPKTPPVSQEPSSQPANPEHRDPEYQQHYQTLSQHLADHLFIAKLPPEQVKAYTRTAHSVWRAMPKAALGRVVAGLSQFHFYENNQELNKAQWETYGKFWRAQGKNPKTHILGGSYDTWGHIHLNGPYDKETLQDGKANNGSATTAQGIYAHEFTHAIDGPEFEISNSPEWHHAFDKELRHEQLTEYGATNRQEGFAEFGRILYAHQSPHNLRVLMARFPRCSAIFKKLNLWPSSPTSSPPVSPSQGGSMPIASSPPPLKGQSSMPKGPPS